MDQSEGSELVSKGPCAACGSSDACASYDDGHTFCYACRARGRGDSTTSHIRKPRMTGLIQGDVVALPKRGISAETCAKFDYRVGARPGDGRIMQLAAYRDADGSVVAQHTRDAGKNFGWVGDAKGATLWGQHLWRGKGRRIVVTEGEIDAMSVAQAFGLTWDVVSLPNGAQSAKKAVGRALEFLEGYDEVVLWLDNDGPGREATAECAPMFTPGRCKIATAARKDANEVLLMDGAKAVTQAVYNAKAFRPGGIVNGEELWDRMAATQTVGKPYPWAGLTAMTTGQRSGTLVTWTSGTGQGKSTSVAQVAYALAFPKDGSEPETVGYVALEEDVGRAAQRFVSHYLGKLVHMPGVATPGEMRAAFDATLGTGRVWLHDHFGSTDSDELIGKLRFMAKGCGCTTIVLDHLSIIVSGMDLAGDERRTIDKTMTMLRTLVEETGITLHLVSHLKRPADDKGHENGAQVSLSQLRGSASIAQLSDMVIGLERNQQADDAEGRLMTMRVLKNRTTGDTGVACKVRYDKTSGLLIEASESVDSSMEKDETCDLPF